MTWRLNIHPAATPAPPTVRPRSLTAPAALPTLPVSPRAARTSLFLGRGLVRPFRTDRKQDFAFAEGEEFVRSAVGQILGTRAATDFTQGELP